MKQWTKIYATALDRGIFEPFSDVWCYCVTERQKAMYKLDILCASDQKSYRRMKPDAAAGLSSDYPQWILDSLAVLAEDGAFQATGEELREIQTQAEVELSGRSREQVGMQRCVAR